MHSHQGQYILYYINHQSINPLTSINHLTSINDINHQTIGINDNMIQHQPVYPPPGQPRVGVNFFQPSPIQHVHIFEQLNTTNLTHQPNNSKNK
jgi:hypothetical protein